ncbi:MAG: DUF2085 domain-containing protein [Candidatus Aminicenantes bacterium]|nr:DUF2085 domain-containing protein [Candidatus Aminicenantes bacterium]
MNRKHRILLVYYLTLGGIIIWLGVIFLAPYLRSQDSSLSAFVYSVFTPICHQIPFRSFHLFGQPLAVCARCLGIYFGILGGTGLYPLINGFSKLSLPRVRIFIIVSLPMIADAGGNFLHLWLSSHWIRFMTGFLWGLILPFYFIVGVSDFFLKRAQEKANRTEKKHHKIQD